MPRKYSRPRPHGPYYQPELPLVHSEESRRKIGVRPTPQPEHGDWRVQVNNPLDALHADSRSVWNRLRMRTAYLADTHPLPLHEAEAAEEIIPIKGWPRFLRLALSFFVLLPVSVVMVFALLVQLYHAAPVIQSAHFWLAPNVWHTILGAFAMLISVLNPSCKLLLIYVYVVGHELTHALATLVCFGKIRKFQVGFDGGYVETDKDNLFIALSPYFVPLWMLVWLGVFGLLNYFSPHEVFDICFYVGFGYWWCFHIYWTLWVIPREQPDMLENGLVFSSLVILLSNISLLLLILAFFGCISLQGYWMDVQVCASRIYNTLADLYTLLSTL